METTNSAKANAMTEAERLQLEREAEIRARIEEARQEREKAASTKKRPKKSAETAEIPAAEPRVAEIPAVEPRAAELPSTAIVAAGEEWVIPPVSDFEVFPRKRRRLRIGPGILLLFLTLIFVLLSATGVLGGPAYYEVDAENGVPDYYRDEEAGFTAAGSSQAVLRINPQPVFYGGSSEGTLHLQNSPENSWDLSVEIRLKKEEQPVFRCGALKPGQYLSYARLDRELEVGEYPATAYFTLYDPLTRRPMGSVGVDLNIVIRR